LAGFAAARVCGCGWQGKVQEEEAKAVGMREEEEKVWAF